MIVQAAVGFALAMFLRDWYLEDIKKLRELHAAEKQESQDNTENNTENENENGTENGTEHENNMPETNNNEISDNAKDNKNNLENNNENQSDINPETADTQNLTNENNIENDLDSTKTQSQTIAELQQIGDKEINVTENKNEAEDNYENQIDLNGEIDKQDMNVIEIDEYNKSNQSDYKVDEIIENMLSESASNLSTDIIEQISNLPEMSEMSEISDTNPDTQIDSQQFDFTDSNYSTLQNNFNTDNETGENLSQGETAAEIPEDYVPESADNVQTVSFDSDIETENNTIDLTDITDEYLDSNMKDISQTAIEVLGENFDFDSLLAEAKVVDITEAENKNDGTKLESDQTIALDLKSEIESEIEFGSTIQKSENVRDIETNNLIDTVISTFDISVPIPQELENFSSNCAQESMPIFPIGMIQKEDAIVSGNKQTFAEFTPPIYVRKKKKK